MRMVREPVSSEERRGERLSGSEVSGRGALMPQVAWLGDARRIGGSRWQASPWQLLTLLLGGVVFGSSKSAG